MKTLKWSELQPDSSELSTSEHQLADTSKSFKNSKSPLHLASSQSIDDEEGDDELPSLSMHLEGGGVVRNVTDGNEVNCHADGDNSVHPPARVRHLNFIDGLGVTVGIIIGSGIFSSPGVALERSGSPGVALIAWVVAGGLVTCTALCYFELGCMFPSAGGDFEYLQQAYGERVSFSFAWFNFFISKPGSQAIIATIFGRYCETAFTGVASVSAQGQQSESPIATWLAVGLITTITLVNCAGIKESSLLQNILTSIKLLLVLFLFVVGLVYCISHPTTGTQNLSVAHSFSGTKDMASVGSAMIACLWSFDGWADLNYLMEDLQNPQVLLPLVVTTGLATVTVAYLLANVAYFAVLDQQQIVDSSAIAYQLGLQVSPNHPLWSRLLPSLLALGVGLSTAGSLNGSIMTGGRAFQAVARDGKAPRYFARVNQAGAPYAALFAQGIWGIVLLLLPGSNFSTLLDYFGPASWFYYALTCACVVKIRFTDPDKTRPFRLPLYPLPIVVVFTLALVIIVSSFKKEPAYTGLAFGFIALSFPVHLVMEKFEKDRQAMTTSTSRDNMHRRLENIEL